MGNVLIADSVDNPPPIVQQGIVSSIVALATGLAGKHLPYNELTN